MSVDLLVPSVEGWGLAKAGRYLSNSHLILMNSGDDSFEPRFLVTSDVYGIWINYLLTSRRDNDILLDLWHMYRTAADSSSIFARGLRSLAHPSPGWPGSQLAG